MHQFLCKNIWRTLIYLKKEKHILEYKQRFEVIKITESQL